MEIESGRTKSGPSFTSWGGGLDWLEVKLPECVPFRPEIADMVSDVRQKKSKVAMATPEYAARVDLRPFGMEAMLHIGKKRGTDHSHKVQFIGTSKFSFNQHLADLERIADMNPLTLQPMRTDLTVDVPGVSMEWVVNHSRVEGKRFAADVGKVPSQGDSDESYMALGSREIETAYVGKRPNCYRIYNKTAERMSAYKSAIRGWCPTEPDVAKWARMAEQKRETGIHWARFERYCLEVGMDADLINAKLRIGQAEAAQATAALYAGWLDRCWAAGMPPSFREFAGMEEDVILTRFERQIGAQQIIRLHVAGDKRKLPLFETLKDVRANAANFNPFASMEFNPGNDGAAPTPGVAGVSGRDYMAGMYYRQLVAERGKQRADAWVRYLTPGHSKKFLKKLAPFIPAQEGAAVITAPELFERYRDAITKQLEAA
jgi:hypothetical protein